jgi:hypothetical protein
MRFRKRVKVFPGFSLNFSNSGISSTVGVRGASITFGKRGTYLNASIPGTGLSHRHKLSGADNFSNSSGNNNFVPAIAVPDSTPKELAMPGEIKSTNSDKLSSSSMVEMHDAIKEAFQDRIELTAEIETVQRRLKIARIIDVVAKMVVIGFVVKWFANNVYEKEDYIIDLQNQINNSKVDIDVTFPPSLRIQYDKLTDSFSALCRSERIWDVTSRTTNDQVSTRSAASSAITRTRVSFLLKGIDIIQSQHSALHLQNANGDDIYIYPAFVVLTKNNVEFALIDLMDLKLEFITQNFLEEEGVPADAEKIGETWAKVNKNGQPDKRFKDNYKIPITKYGQINFKTSKGLNESYSFSNHKHSQSFSEVFSEYQQSL